MNENTVSPQDLKERDMQAVAIDYESFYCDKAGTRDYSLSLMPTWKYCADPRFDAYLVAICGWEITDDGIFEPERRDRISPDGGRLDLSQAP